MQRDVDELVRYLGADIGITKAGYLVKNAMPGQGAGIRQGGKLYALSEEGDDIEIGEVSSEKAIRQAAIEKWRRWFCPVYPQALGGFTWACSYVGALYVGVEAWRPDQVTEPFYGLTQYIPSSNTIIPISDVQVPYQMIEWDGKLWINGYFAFDGSTVEQLAESGIVDTFCIYNNELYATKAYNGQTVYKLTTGGGMYPYEWTIQFQTTFSTVLSWPPMYAFGGMLFTGWVDNTPGTETLHIYSFNGVTWTNEFSILTPHKDIPVAFFEVSGVLYVVLNRFGVGYPYELHLWHRGASTWEYDFGFTPGYHYVDIKQEPIIEKGVAYFVRDHDIYSVNVTTQKGFTVQIPTLPWGGTDWMRQVFFFDGVLYALGQYAIYARTRSSPSI